jgi:hypothetical protein
MTRYNVKTRSGAKFRNAIIVGEEMKLSDILGILNRSRFVIIDDVMGVRLVHTDDIVTVWAERQEGAS